MGYELQAEAVGLPGKKGPKGLDGLTGRVGVGGDVGDPFSGTPTQYNVSDTSPNTDWVKVLNSYQNGVVFYILESSIISGSLSYTTINVFCRLVNPNKPVSNAVVGELTHKPPLTIKSDDGCIVIDTNGVIRYTYNEQSKRGSSLTFSYPSIS